MKDLKARNILFSKYWNPSIGWQNKKVSEEEFLYAKSLGYMFDNVSLNHNAIVKKCINICHTTSKEKVIDSFLTSLSSRDLAQRSAIASFACGQSLSKHKFTKKFMKYKSLACLICDEYKKENDIDLNILNFERHKFAGVRHLSPLYIWFDLERFKDIEIKMPNKYDIRILEEILSTLKKNQADTLSNIEKRLTKIIKSNKNERVGIISTLGYLGILNIPNFRPLYMSYVPMYQRKFSNYNKSDWPFPADLWLPKFGINDAAVEYWFGKYIKKP